MSCWFSLKIFFDLNDLLFFVKKYFMFIVVSYSIIFSFVAGWLLFSASPYSNQLDAVSFVVENSDGGLVWTDWSYGYYVLAAGGKPSNFGGDSTDDFVTVDLAEAKGGGLVLTEDFDSNYLLNNCSFLRSFGKGFRNELGVWKC